MNSEMPNDKPSKPTIFITMSLSFAIRNFFETGIIDELAKYYYVVVLATPNIAAALKKLTYDQRAEVIPLDLGKEPLFWHVLRLFKKKTYLEGRRSATEAIWEKYFPRPRYKRLGGMIVKWVVRAVNPIKLYCWLDNLETRITKDSSLKGLFSERKPTFVFFTHTSLQHEEVIFRNCLAAKVPMIYMILSWDHLSAKVTLHAKFDKILVWNQHTRAETLRTYPNFRSEQVKVVGIPQYDLYAEKPTTDYAGWCARYGLDSTKKTILFSTMPQERHDQQHIIIQDLLSEMVLGERIPPGYQMLIKCHPFDSFTGYQDVIRGKPAAIHGTNFGESRDQKGWQPSSGEIEASRDALYYCSMNINIFSTVTIEAAYFGKPIISIAFDPETPTNRIPCREYYNWDHFKHIVDKQATILVHSIAETCDAISMYHRNPDFKKKERALLVTTYIGNHLGNASQNVVQSLKEFGMSFEKIMEKQ